MFSHVKRSGEGEVIEKKALVQHLLEVAAAANQLSPIPNREDEHIIKQIHLVNASGHDFGKYTPYFQTYLLTGEKKNNLHFHSYISAVWTAYLLCEKYSWEGWGRYAPLLGFLAVLHHHDDLGSLEHDIPLARDVNAELMELLGHISPHSDKLERLEKQIESLIPHSDTIAGDYQYLLGISVSVHEFRDGYAQVFKKLDQLKQQFAVEDDTVKVKLFYYLQLLFSLLIDGDKHSAAGLPFTERCSLPPNLVDQYAAEKFTREPESVLDRLRVDFAQTAKKQLARFNENKRLYTMTSPTGSGKTLTSFAVALGMREAIRNTRGYEARIIYALPFTSIIEQNFAVLRDVLAFMPDFSASEGRYLLKHHHLAEVAYKENNGEKTLSEALLLMESWEAEVVVTTFYQLLHSVIGFKNRYLKKIHQLCGSIIILDEVQNIPAEYWPLLNNVLQQMSHHFGCYILLLTATKPFIFEPEVAQEWLSAEKVKQYFQSLDRTRIVPVLSEDGESWSEEEWFERFVECYDASKSHLIILNTVQSSMDMYRRVKGLAGDRPVYYLSTNITPRERMDRLNDIAQDLEDEVPIIVVSTQVVEAGVDLDFDIVVRDLAPIDSIVQAAGRCNRRGKPEKGTLYVIPLKRNESKRSDCQLVYGPIHRQLAVKGLTHEVIHERDFYPWIESYFSQKVKKTDQTLSRSIWDGVRNLRFYDKEKPSRDEAVSRFRLIEQRLDMASLFVQMDEEAENVWERYETEVIGEPDVKRRKEAYLKLRRAFQSYVISVPLKRVKNLEQFGSVFLLRSELLNQYYKIGDTGFIRKPEEAEVWML